MLDRMFDMGPGAAMRLCEAEAGYDPILREDPPAWLHLDDWEDDFVISKDGFRIRIVAIIAVKPHNGAFSRLVTGICKAGFMPVVVVPLGQMRPILSRWGWMRGIHGSSFAEREDRWFPSPAWIKERAKR